MPTDKQLKFINPFGGKRSPISISGLFLLDPSVFIKIAGSSMRGMLIETLGEALHKKLERIVTGKQKASEATVIEFLNKLPGDAPILIELRAAVLGDVRAQEKFDNLGPWELFLLGMKRELSTLESRLRFVIDLERASMAPLRQLVKGNLGEAAELIGANPMTSVFVWPEVSSLLNTYISRKELVPLQASIAMEVHLSILAAWEVDLALKDGASFSRFVPRADSPRKNPAALFFRDLKSRIGAKTLREFADHPKLQRLSLDMTTLKRWSAGTHYPDPIWLGPIIQSCFHEADRESVWNDYWATRQINFIGYYCQLLRGKALRIANTDEASKLLPWPSYPFGYATFENWIGDRYPIWLDYHRSRSQGTQ